MAIRWAAAMKQTGRLWLDSPEWRETLRDVARAPALFLSASQPVVKYEKDDLRYGRNLHHVSTARPELIRAAVVELRKWSFHRGLVLVYGGHPAISPLVLEAARRFGSPSDSP